MEECQPLIIGCVDDTALNIPKLVVLEWVDGGRACQMFFAMSKDTG